MIQLWTTTISPSLNVLVKEVCSSWANICIDSKGKYLGLFIGPGADKLSREKPLRKYRERAALWASLHLGMNWSIAIYDTFIASRAQFLLPPLVFQSLSLLSLPIVCIVEIFLFKGTFSLWQWSGVVAIILAGFLAARSKQTQLKAIQ